VRCFSDAMYTSTSFASVAEPDSMVGLFWQRDRFYDRAGRAISIAHWAKLRGNCEYRTIGEWCDGNGFSRSYCLDRVVRCPTRITGSLLRSGLSITLAGLCRWSSGESVPGMTTKSRQLASNRWCCALGEQ
jgi:hypothetical protein